jgi:ABC-type phosphate transport system permease subunit
VLGAVYQSLSVGQFLLLLAVFTALSMWVYWHASRHGSKHATAWGVAVFLVWPVILIYFIHYRLTRRRF